MGFAEESAHQRRFQAIREKVLLEDTLLFVDSQVREEVADLREGSDRVELLWIWIHEPAAPAREYGHSPVSIPRGRGANRRDGSPRR